SQDVLRARSPELLIGLAKDGDQGVAHDLSLGWVRTLEDVDADRHVPVSRIYQDNAIRFSGWNPLAKVADKVAFGVDRPNADPLIDVLEREVEQQRALS